MLIHDPVFRLYLFNSFPLLLMLMLPVAAKAEVFSAARAAVDCQSLGLAAGRAGGHHLLPTTERISLAAFLMSFAISSRLNEYLRIV